ncbi:MAG: SDR family oxidoreductase [Deltaproteobacteria bacterium]|nr:MAG: SDR family oxidoreductase [Deltaproteobacteria bacterium]
MDASGKVAVVTGGGRGIGRAIALKLAGAGADVAILYRKRPEPAAEVKAEIEKMGRRGEAYQCDVSDQNRVHEVFAEIKEKFKRIDILVNNAGLASWGNFIHDTTFLEWDKIMKANIYGPYNCIREVLPLMREQKGGYIISLSSVITQVTPPTGGPYAVAKAGVEALTKVVANEELGNNIRVNAIAPGLVETEMGRKLVGVEDMKTMYPNMPFGRVCQPEDIANMVLYLVSEEGSYIQGQVIHINGGGKLF